MPSLIPITTYQCSQCLWIHDEKVSECKACGTSFNSFLALKDRSCGNCSILDCAGMNQLCGSYNNNDIKILDDIIAKLKLSFADFTYENALIQNSYFGNNNFAIIVRNIKSTNIKEFLNFVNTNVYEPLINFNKNLPLIITLQ
jgi:hypothetical protein